MTSNGGGLARIDGYIAFLFLMLLYPTVLHLSRIYGGVNFDGFEDSKDAALSLSLGS